MGKRIAKGEVGPAPRCPRLRAAGRFGIGSITNISVGGAFIATPMALRPKSRVARHSLHLIKILTSDYGAFDRTALEHLVSSGRIRSYGVSALGHTGAERAVDSGFGSVIAEVNVDSPRDLPGR